jgi:hypothetical protein
VEGENVRLSTGDVPPHAEKTAAREQFAVRAAETQVQPACLTKDIHHRGKPPAQHEPDLVMLTVQQIVSGTFPFDHYGSGVCAHSWLWLARMRAWACVANRAGAPLHPASE